MAHKQFSTGLPKLDTFLGGIQAGDSFVAVLSQKSHFSTILRAASLSSSKIKIPIVRISNADISPDLSPELRDVVVFDAQARKLKPNQFALELRRFVSSQKPGSLIILDELSSWNSLLHREKNVVELFALLSELTAKKKSFLMTSVLRSGFNNEQLSKIIHGADLSVDIVVHRERLYCLPITQKNRYVPRDIFPLRLDGTEAERGSADGTLSIREQGQFERQLDVIDEEYEKLFNNASEAFIIFDLNGDYRKVNVFAAELLGYSTEELLTISPLALLSRDRHRDFLRFLAGLQKKKNNQAEFAIVKKNGKTIQVEIQCSEIGPGRFLGALRDLSARQKIEQAILQREADLRQVLDRMPGCVIIAVNNSIEYANDAALGLLEFGSYDEISGKGLKDIFTPQSYKQFQKFTKEEYHGKKIDLQFLRKDGAERTCEVSLNETSFRRRNALIVLMQNVTEQRTISIALADSERKLRLLVQHSNQPTALIRDGRFDEVNNAFLTLFGFDTPQQILGEDIAAVIHGEQAEKMRQKMFRRSSPSSVLTFEFEGKRKDGSTVPVEIAVSPALRNNEVVLSYRDMTAIHSLQQELSQHLGELSILEQINVAVNSSSDANNVVKHCSQKIMELCAFDVAAAFLIDKPSKDLALTFHRHVNDVFLENVSRLPLDEGLGGFLAKTREPYLFSLKKYPSYLPFRSVFNKLGLSSVCFLPLLAQEKFVGMILLGTKLKEEKKSISTSLFSALGHVVGEGLDRVRQYQHIKESEERQRTLIDSLDDVVTMTLPNGTVQFISPSVERLTGYVPKEFYRTSSLWLSLVHPDDKAMLLERTAYLNEHQKGSTMEYRILPKGKASYRWVRERTVPIHDDQENISGVYGWITDTTSVKESLEELRRSIELTSNVVSSIQEGIVVFDRDLKCIRWNQVMERMTGIHHTKATGLAAASLFHQLSMPEMTQLLDQALHGNTVSANDAQFKVVETGRQGYVWCRYAPLVDRHGVCAGVVGMVADVSNRKKLETEMRESEQVLRNVIDTMGDILVITDLKGNILEVNRSFLRILGYSRTEVIGIEFPYPWLLDEEMGRFVLWISELRDKNWLHDFDTTWLAKDASHIPMSLSTTLLRNSMGEPIAMLNIARDITERTRLAKDLESRNKQIEMINRIISKANQTMDFDEIFHAIAEEIAVVIPADSINVGLLSEDGKVLSIYALKGPQALHKGESLPIDKTVSQFALQSNQPIVIPDLAADEKYSSLPSFARGIRSQIALPIHIKGEAFGTLILGTKEANTYSDEHSRILKPLAEHIGTIIDRVQLFQQVTEDSTYIHNLLDSIDSIVYTVDNQYRIREVNKAWQDFMQESGYPGYRNYQGMNLIEILPSEPLKNILRNVAGQLIEGSLRIVTEEFIHTMRNGDRIFQLTANPMVIERRMTGIVFTQTDITARKKTEEELKRSNEQLLGLNEISTVINTSLDLTGILETTIPLLKKQVNAKAVLVYLIDAPKNDLRLVKQLGFESIQNDSMLRLGQASSVTGEAVMLGKALYIGERAYLDERIIPENRKVLRQANIEAMAVIPLASKKNVLGALDIFYDVPYEFSAQEKQMLGLVGNQVGTAIENAQLYGELRSQIDRLTVLYELSQKLTSLLDIEQIFMAVNEHLQQVVPFDTFQIDTYDSLTKTVTPLFTVETVEGVPRISSDRQPPLAIAKESAEGKVISSRHSYQDVETNGMYVPMLTKETIIGIMSVRAIRSQAYTETQLRLLESIGNLTAIALEKAKLYEETVKISLEIQRRNKELDDFTYVVSHDLKEPLISIEGFSRILQSDYHESIQGEGKEYLDSMVGATTRMKGLIDDLLMLSRVSRPSESFKSVSLAPIVQEIKTDMEFTIRQKGVNFIFPPDLPTVFGNETQIKIALRNLIGNAVKFNNRPHPLVEIGFRNAENNYYLFFIRDNGIGISKEFHEKIFVIFQRLHRREEYEGSGAGLAIVKKIIETHKGTIYVESEVGKGSTFFFTLPKGYSIEG